MFVFSGLGFLVPLAAVAGFFIPIFGEAWFKSQFGYRPPNTVVVTCMAILPFLGILAIDWFLKKRGPTQKAVDVRTGSTVEVAQMHTFMFLPVKWCAYLWLGLAAAAWIATKVS